MPVMYYENYVANTLNFTVCMADTKIKSIIYSLAAAAFGELDYVPIDEEHGRVPINPYGHSELMVEQILKDFDKAYDMKSVCLRYFNAAGADADGELGERHIPETHLVPLVLQAASGRRDAISIFGTDYDTPDGTGFEIIFILRISAVRICWRWNLWLMVARVVNIIWVMARAIRFVK